MKRKNRNLWAANLCVIFSLVLAYSCVSASVVGWMGINRINKTLETDRIELMKNIEIENRADIEFNYYFREYSLGAGYSRLLPGNINEFILKGSMRQKNSYRLGLEVNVSKDQSGVLFSASKYLYPLDIPFKFHGEILLYKEYGSLRPDLKYFFSDKGYLEFSAEVVDNHGGQTKKMVGCGIYQILSSKNAVKAEVHYSSKNGFELFGEPRFRVNKFFYLALETYCATKNNSAIGVSLIYSPVAVKKKVIKKPVKIEKAIVEKPVVEEPEEEPKQEPKVFKKPEHKKEIVEPKKIEKTPGELKTMLERIVNTHYAKGVSFYCDDKFSEAIKEWKEALRLLQSVDFAGYSDAQDYVNRCNRNIKNAEKKLEIIKDE